MAKKAKLSLKKKTLRKLNSDDLAAVGGGLSIAFTTNCANSAPPVYVEPQPVGGPTDQCPQPPVGGGARFGNTYRANHNQRLRR